MTAPADCHLCGRILPLGGVLDDVGRPVHDWCRGVRKLEIAHDATQTARRVAKEGKPRQTRPHPLIQGAA